ncbi:MAG: T9SS type A sorting domain-containing protein [Bacteroidota bacterium]
MLILQIFILFYPISIDAQTIKFNNVYTNGRISRNIVEVDTGYVIVGSNGNPVKILAAFIDTNGNNIWNKEYGDSIYTYYHGIENSLNTCSNGYSLAGSKYNSTTDSEGGLLITFNNNFDTLNTRIYLYDTLRSFFYGGKEISTKNYLLTGATKVDYQGLPLTVSDILLIKTDSIGNMLWHKNYGGSDSDYGYKVLETYDNGYLIGGWSRSFNTQIPQVYNRGDWYIVKTDTAGNFQWHRHYGYTDFEDGRITGLISTKDSCYIICGPMAVAEPYPNFPVYQGCLMKMDKNYNILWDKKYDKANGNTGFINIIEKEDSTLTTIGYNENYLGKQEARMFNLTKDGDILWHRRYKAFNSDTSNNHFFDLVKTKDNGYAIAGYATNSYIIPSQQIWVVKTDSLGCDDAGSCADTVMFFNVSVADTVCFEDTAEIWFNLNGRSAPYHISCNNGWELDSIFYPYNGNSYIDTVYEFISLVKDTTYTFSFTLTDPWGAVKYGTASFYVKDCDIGVNSISPKEEVKIYPNPANTEVRVRVIEEKIYEIKLINSQGKIVNQIVSNQTETVINIESLPQGVYFISVTCEDLNFIGKFVKI